MWRRPVQGCQTAIFESSPFGFSKQFDDVHHQIWVSRDDCDQKNGMFLHRNEKLRPPVIREMSGQTPRGTFNRLEFWNAVPPGHLMKNLRQIANLQHTGTGFIGNAYLLRLYESIKVHTHTNPGRGLSDRVGALKGPRHKHFGILEARDEGSRHSPFKLRPGTWARAGGTVPVSVHPPHR